MPPSVDATLLPPPPSSDTSLGAYDEDASTRSLDEVGVEAVLGAMIEQRKRSSRPAASELADLHDVDETPSYMKVR